MQKYRIQVTAVVEVEAENVMQARDAASDVQLIGEQYGYKRNRHERDATDFRVRVLDYEMSNPQRLRTK